MSNSENGKTYNIRVINNSFNVSDVMVFQKQIDSNAPSLLPLAWLTRTMYPNSNVEFQWDVDYSFMWSETGELVPGVVFNPSEVRETALGAENEITFTHNQVYQFANQKTTSPEGDLIIMQDSSIPFNQASVGIGMSNSGMFAIQAQPNVSFTFEPQPRYFVALGHYKQGEVLNVNSLYNTVEVYFPANVYSMTVILNQNNTWTVEPSR